MDENTKPFGEPIHEHRSWRDCVRVKRHPFLCWSSFPYPQPFLTQPCLFFLLFLRLLCRLEPSGSLLIHLRSRRDSIDCHEQELTRSHRCKDAFHCIDDAKENIVLCLRRWAVLRLQVQQQHKSSAESVLIPLQLQLSHSPSQNPVNAWPQLQTSGCEAGWMIPFMSR